MYVYRGEYSTGVFEVLSQYLERQTLEKTDKLDKTNPKQTNIKHDIH